MKIIRKHSKLDSVFPEYYSTLGSDKQLVLSQYTEAQVVDENKILLYSFVTDAILLLTQLEYEMICDMDFAHDYKLFEVLKENGFFVDKQEDELALMIRQRLSMSEYVSQTLKVVIMPTTDCNARCKYCIGHNNKRIKMSLETAQKVSKYIIEQSKRYDSIRFDWYGGEPLIEDEIITFICKEIKKALPDKTYSSVITTNLALLDENMISKAIDVWHIKKINVTIDGTEHEHNQRKNYIDKELNGYQHTLQCIRLLLDKGVRVFCRFNIDRNNEKELTYVLDDLRQFIDNELFYFFVSPLRGEDWHTEFYTNNEYNELFYRTGKLMIEKGIKNAIDSFIPKVALGFCLAKNKNCFVVGPNGDLYRCNLDDLSIDNATGNVFDGLIRNQAYDRFINLDLEKKCETCRYLPICQGGCPTEQAQQSKSNNQCVKFKFKLEAFSKLLAEYYS